MPSFISSRRRVLLFAILGIALFSALVLKLGPAKIGAEIEHVGWTFGLALAVNFVSQCTSARGLSWCLHETGIDIPFFRLWTSRVCGEAVNTLTPIGFLGGDPARIMILKASCGGINSSAGVILDRGIQILSTAILIILAAVATSIKMALPRTMEWAVAVAVLAAVLVVLFLFRIWEIGPVQMIRKICTPILPESIQQKIDWPKLQETDERIRQFSQHDRRHFWFALGWQLLTRALGILEIWIIGSRLTPRFDALGSLILSGLTPAIGLTFAIFPGAVGVLEGGYGVVFYFMGIEPALGISLQIIRRVRGLVWSVVGLGLLARYKVKPSTVLSNS